MNRAPLIVVGTALAALILGYGIGYLHHERLSGADVEAQSRSMLLAGASKNLFLLGTVKDRDGDTGRALATFLYGDLVAIQSSLEAERSSPFNEKACALVAEVEKSGIDFGKSGGAEDKSRQKVLVDLRSFCANPRSPK